MTKHEVDREQLRERLQAVADSSSGLVTPSSIMDAFEAELSRVREEAVAGIVEECATALEGTIFPTSYAAADFIRQLNPSAQAGRERIEQRARLDEHGHRHAPTAPEDCERCITLKGKE